ncbi:MAG TPA: cobalamin-dependent protein [Polyangium sp.]|nr:cobalamin-dependent protein [Polyangium sp.]
MPFAFDERMHARVPAIVDRVMSLVPMTETHLGESWLEATARLVDFALAANAMRRSALFVEYVGWLESVMRSRGAPLGQLTALLQEISREAETIGGPAASSVVGIVQEGLARIGHDAQAVTVSTSVEENATDSLSKTYLELLLAAKRKDAVDLVNNALDQGLTLEDLYLRVLQPAMRKVGQLWQLNEISVAQEHYVSAATQLIISQLYPRLLDGPRNGKIMIAGCISSNLHEIGLRFLCDIFELRGWDTHFYGANTPTRALHDVIRTRRPDVVAIGATLASQLPHVASFISEMRKDPVTAQVRILVGGTAFWGNEDLWKEMGADGFASDASTAVRVASELTGGN